MSENSKILKCNFEVFGLVQVFSFKTNLQMKAKYKDVRGWCADTNDDSVKGEIEATSQAFSFICRWLEEIGSPDSIIDRAIFSYPEEIDDYTFETFEIRE